MMLRRVAIALSVFSCSVSAAEGLLPPVDSYGFDWLKPNSTRCKKLTPELIARFKQCSALEKSNSFGLDFPGQACRVGKRSEFMVYSTPKHCQAAFETMQANAP